VIAAPLADFTVVDGEVNGRGGAVRIRDYIPAASTHATPFLWIHGGGFTMGGLNQKESDAPARYLAASGRRIRTLEYRLAPSFGLWGKIALGDKPGRFPAAHHDVLDVLHDFRSVVGGAVSIGGASAGANLAAGATIALRTSGQPGPRALVLAYGVLHAELPDNEQVERELTGPLARWAFNPAMVRRMNLNYVGGEAAMVPGAAFPGGADLTGFPATLVLDAQNDRLRKSGDAFARELRAASRDVGQITIPAMHGFLNSPKKQQFADAMASVQAWLEAHD
jgi:acetyl esterase